MRYLLLILPLLVLTALPGFGATAYLGGYSGLVITPNEVLVPTGSFDLGFHDLIGIFGGSKDLRTYSLTYGALPNLEVGASIVSSDGTDVALNGKFSILTETPNRPAILIGAWDATSMVNRVNDQATFYIVASKNLTPTASQIAGKPSVPFRLNVGFGSGFLNGFFAGLDWVLTPRLSLMGEFTHGGFEGKKNRFNAGARWAVTNDLRLDAGTIGFDDFAFGLNYRFTR